MAGEVRAGRAPSGQSLCPGALAGAGEPDPRLQQPRQGQQGKGRAPGPGSCRPPHPALQPRHLALGRQVVTAARGWLGAPGLRVCLAGPAGWLACSPQLPSELSLEGGWDVERAVAPQPGPGWDCRGSVRP